MDSSNGYYLDINPQKVELKDKEVEDVRDVAYRTWCYFKDNLKTVCQNARISPAMFKASPELQIMAVANYLNDLCKKHKH